MYFKEGHINIYLKYILVWHSLLIVFKIMCYYLSKFYYLFKPKIRQICIFLMNLYHRRNSYAYCPHQRAFTWFHHTSKLIYCFSDTILCLFCVYRLVTNTKYSALMKSKMELLSKPVFHVSVNIMYSLYILEPFASNVQIWISLYFSYWHHDWQRRKWDNRGLQCLEWVF